MRKPSRSDYIYNICAIYIIYPDILFVIHPKMNHKQTSQSLLK